MGAELDRERQVYTKSVTDLREGQGRIDRQVALLARMSQEGHDTDEGERLLEVFRETLSQWQRHHVMIEERIAYLQARDDAPRAIDGVTDPRSGEGAAGRR